MAAVAIAAAWIASAQSAAPPSFDVASVKSAAPCCAAGEWRESKAADGRIDFRYVTLKYCIAFAWRVKEFQISGPPWLGTNRFDILAKGPEGTKQDQLPEMVQSLLADRFKLQIHHETKEFSVFALVVAKDGPKLKESPADPNAAEGASYGISSSPNGAGRIEVRRGNMTSLANTLVRLLGRPVQDLTGLTGRYDFDLEFLRDDLAGMVIPPGAGGSPGTQPEFGTSLVTSLQRVGLKLEQRKPALDAIVVDSAEKTPTEN